MKRKLTRTLATLPRGRRSAVLIEQTDEPGYESALSIALLDDYGDLRGRIMIKGSEFCELRIALEVIERSDGGGWSA